MTDHSRPTAQELSDAYAAIRNQVDPTLTPKECMNLIRLFAASTGLSSDDMVVRLSKELVD